MKNKSAEILAELWENAVFDKQSYEGIKKLAFEKITKNNKKKTSSDSPPPDIFFALTTARNKNLITSAEQKKLRNTVIGFFGLSVGSHAALTWMMLSRADIVKIIDFDKISPTNLNRLRFGWNTVGKYKTVVVRELLQAINPYSRVIEISAKKNIKYEKIVSDFPKLSLIVDAIDDIDGKVKLRKLAKKNKIPLISAADVGDNIILDIERYDTDQGLKPFFGLIPENINFSALPLLERKKMIIRLVGFEKNSNRMLDSLSQIGKSILTWPQLGTTATIAGGIVATAIKKLVLGEKIKSGRYYLSIDDLLVQDYNSVENIRLRKIKIAKIKEKLSL